MSIDCLGKSIVDLAGLIERREVSPVEVVQAHLAQIEREPFHAFISVYADESIAAARVAEKEILSGAYRGVLHGVPIGVKDNIYVRDRVTTMGSKIHAGFVPVESATALERLEDAGAIIVGKTNLHEYALGVTSENPFYGTTKNPWALDRLAGGSSGGSAAAVAGGLVSAGIGTDTSGSIRIPAAMCGIVGMKPTYGRVSRHGCFPEAWTLDHMGHLTRTVNDAAILLDAMSGYDSKDPTSLRLPPTRCEAVLTGDVRGLTIGVEEEFYFASTDPAVEHAVRQAIATLESLGAEVRRVSIPALQSADYALTIIDSVEFAAVHQANLRERPQDFGEDVRQVIATGVLPSGVDYVQAQQLRALVQRAMREVFEEVDLLVAPTLPIQTPTIGTASTVLNGKEWQIWEALVKLLGPANLVGLPAASVPCGMCHGMPIGVQIIGPALGEARVLQVARALELTEPLAGAGPSFGGSGVAVE